jgi:hypothetical protein
MARICSDFQRENDKENGYLSVGEPVAGEGRPLFAVTRRGA